MDITPGGRGKDRYEMMPSLSKSDTPGPYRYDAKQSAHSIVKEKLYGGYTGAHLVAIAVAFMLGMAAAVSYKEHRIGTSENTKIAQVVERVGRLPVMGYNTWNAYYCDIDEARILKTAELMKSLGLLGAGYNYVNIDDCYSEKNRSESGDIVADRVRFPSGMKDLTDQIHDMGFKAGIYSDSGWFTCQLYPGSFQNEARDAKLFQVEWGFDLLKYDNCAVPFDELLREGIIGSRYNWHLLHTLHTLHCSQSTSA